MCIDLIRIECASSQTTSRDSFNPDWSCRFGLASVSLTLDIAVIYIDIEVLQTVAQQGLSVVHDHMDIAFAVFTSIHVSLFFLSLQTKSTRSGLAEGGE